MIKTVYRRLRSLLRFLSINPLTLWYIFKIRLSGQFDRDFYRGINPLMPWICKVLPERHYVVFGEAAGLQPNGAFSPGAYLRHNPDLKGLRRPFLHYLSHGRFETRVTRDLPEADGGSGIGVPALRPAEGPFAPYAVVAHIYYHDLWPEIRERLNTVALPFDLYVTITYKDDETDALIEQIRADFPAARVVPMPNHGRDIFPFVHLVNAGLLAPYRAICKLHTKKSPHRQDGHDWRRHLIAGVLPETGLEARLETFLADPEAAIWVADGQHFEDPVWWGSNEERTRELLGRLEIRVDRSALSFPAGSIYWMKPVVLSMIRGLQLTEADFEREMGQLDGTVGHAFERALGYIVAAGGMSVRQTTQLEAALPARPAARKAGYVSAFYLPQFHRTPENDAWWGRGFTEWVAATRAQPNFPGHAQPQLPGELGFYDLRVPEAMGDQAALATAAGIDAFCVYHYWFDGRRILEAPLDRLMQRPDVDFPFYLCWANESWRRNWDGLSGEVLLGQGYGPGFERALAESVAPYMRDARYQRPDGARLRFVIYRPDDMPEPEANIARLRAAFRDLGLGEIELGAVRFHIEGEHPFDPAVMDFWVEMPPHGLVTGADFLFGGPDGNRLDFEPVAGFRGLIYDYDAVIGNSLSSAHAAGLPANTIAGVMPSWDNTARRGKSAHAAYGANPIRFQRWLRGLSEARLDGSYRNELFINAWNEWAERAVLEPSRQYGRSWLEVLKEWR